MLSSLHIQNVAVIKNLDIDFSEGFTVLSGETGAGKSIILDTIHLLLGARSNKDLIRSGEERATVAAIFDSLGEDTVHALEELGVYPDEEGKIYLQRTLFCDGRSQIKLATRTITQAQLREIGAALITIHGQNDNQYILNRANHINFLDAYGMDRKKAEAYTLAYETMLNIKKKLDSLNRDEAEKNRTIEILKFQVDDIEKAGLKPGEEERLLEQKKKIQNLERITKQTKVAYKALYRNDKIPSAFELINKASDMLLQIGDVINDAQSHAQRLESIAYEIESIASDVYSYLDDSTEDAGALLDKIEGRLEIISKLKRKYGSDIPQILQYAADKKAQLAEIELSDEYIRKYSDEYTKALSNAKAAAAELSDIRRKSALELCRKIEESLAFLDMEKVKFKISIEQRELCPTGADQVEFLISTNAGEQARALEKIASGGELSRIMLAIKHVMRNKNSTDTIIFDEIDTGVSGRNAEKIGLLLQDSAKGCQILCVTHSAQVAAKADNHFLITKKTEGECTETSALLLDYDGRVEEISRILGGIEITEAIRQSAKEALQHLKNNTQ